MTDPLPKYSPFVTEPNEQTLKNQMANMAKTEPAPHTVRIGDRFRGTVTVAFNGVQVTRSFEIAGAPDPSTWPFHGPSGRIDQEYAGYSELVYQVGKRATESLKTVLAALYGRF